MYGLFTDMWVISMVHVGKYTTPMDPMFSSLKFFPKKHRGDPAGVRNPRDQTRHQKTHWAREARVCFWGKGWKIRYPKKGETPKNNSF